MDKPAILQKFQELVKTRKEFSSMWGDEPSVEDTLVHAAGRILAETGEAMSLDLDATIQVLLQYQKARAATKLRTPFEHRAKLRLTPAQELTATIQ